MQQNEVKEQSWLGGEEKKKIALLKSNSAA